MGMATMVLLAASFGQMSEEFYQDFRGGEFHPALNRFGPEAASAMRSESRGLRITLASGRQDKAAVGVTPRFRIAGDFEITVGYQLLAVEKPKTGIGAGIKVWGKIQADEFQAMTLMHALDPDGSGAWLAMFATGDDPKKRKFQMKSQPTRAQSGRLRLVRTGSELSFQVAEDGREQFQEIQRVTVATGEVVSLRIGANTSGSPTGARVRLVDLRIRASALPGKPTTLPRRRQSLWWVVLGLIVILAAGGGGFALWWYRPQARR